MDTAGDNLLGLVSFSVWMTMSWLLVGTIPTPQGMLEDSDSEATACTRGNLKNRVYGRKCVGGGGGVQG